jgi:hypothetical protein
MSTFFTKTPDELLARYLHAVRFWLPKGHEDDILAELSEDISSQFDEKAAELGHPLTETDAAAILKRTGSPIIVANRYQGQRYLIGPVLFPVYEFVMRLVLLWILVPVYLIILAPINLANTNGDWGLAALRTFGGLWSGLFIAAGTITLVFAVLERSHVKFELSDKWDPLTLPAVTDPSPATSFRKTMTEMAFSILGLVWLLLIPNHPFAIFGPAASFLKLTSAWRPFYIPFVVLSALNVLSLWVALLRPQWKWFLPTFKLFNAAAFMIILFVGLRAALHLPITATSPFVTLVSPETAPQLARIAAVVNVSILLALLATWLGMAIATPLQTWEWMRNLRRGSFPPQRRFPSCSKVLL